MTESTRSQAASIGWLPLSAVAALGVVWLSSSFAQGVAGSYPDTSIWVRWVLVPAWVMAVSWVLLAPGVMVVAGFANRRSVSALVLLGFAASQTMLIVATSLAKLAGAVPFTRGSFVLVLGGLVALSSGYYVWRGRGGYARRLARADLVPLAALGLVGPVLAAVLMPEIFWQDLNPDGFEAFEIGRALQWVVVPRFPNSSGFQGLGIGMVSMAWSNHWWTLLAGLIEASCRLPLTLHSTAMVAGVAALVEHGQDRRLTTLEWGALLSTVWAVVLVLAFNASYDPYNVDLSSPTAFETLTVALLCGMVYAMWTRSWGWLALFALMAILARPTGLLVGVMSAAAMFVLNRSWRRDAGVVAALSIGAFAVAYVGYEVLAVRFLGERQNPGYGTASLLERFRYLTFTEPQRLLWVILPAGLVPWFSMAWWRRHDHKSQMLILVTVAYTAAFLPLAFTNLHQFVPAMVLPVVVYWRLALQGGAPGRWITGALAGAVVSIVFAWPANRQVDRDTRSRAQQVVVTVGRFDGTFAEYRQALHASVALEAVLRPDWDIADLARERAGGGQTLFYAARTLTGGRPLALVQDSSLAPPASMVALRTRRGATAWVSDTLALAALRRGEWDLGWRRRAYAIPRESMFSFIGASKHAYDIDAFGAARRVFRMIFPRSS